MPKTQNLIRLNKFLAERGVASRRKADELIKARRVTVNGVRAEQGMQVSEDDVVRVFGKIVSKQPEQKVYFALNKPKGVLSSVKDPFYNQTVRTLLGEVEERIYPVGRLDKDSHGLMILTNDGELAKRVTHPSHCIEKVYRVEFSRALSRENAARFLKGITLEEGLVRARSVRVNHEERSRVEIVLTEGRKRQIRRMASACNLGVLDLERTAIGPVTLGRLAEGKYRPLTKKEIEILKGIR